MKTRVRRIPAVFLFGVTALVALVAEAAAPSPLDTMFTGYKAIGSTKWDVKANAVVQWKAMMDRFKQQQADCQPTDGCARFKQLVATLTGLSTLDQMKAVHRVEYALPYVEDINNYKKADYWATPYETLSIGSGDAEDFAILDYYAMRAAGMPAAAMRVMAVRLKSQGGVGHAVLAIDTTPEPQILDHRVPPIMAVSVVHKEFQPAIGVNEDGWWVYVGAAQ
jgi:predicted transglutaminase-like cysteine proteinase